jgi:hypothetical protein
MVTFIGSRLQFVDAGDYDGDGASEVAFFNSDHWGGGYTIFWNHFEVDPVFRTTGLGGIGGPALSWREQGR